MKKKSKYVLFQGLVILLSLILTSSAADKKSIFPSSESLFGVTMPSMQYVIGREEDQKKTIDDGDLYTYLNVSPTEYYLFSRYVAAEGLLLKSHTNNDEEISIELSLNDATITFRYNYPEREVNVLYPKGTKAESAATDKELPEHGILPEIEQLFGVAVPQLSFLLPLHPEPSLLDINGFNQIQYLEVSMQEYNTINRFLSGKKYDVQSSTAKDGMVSAILSDQKGSFGITYYLQEQKLIITCPELYFLDESDKVEEYSGALILPELAESLGVILPRISTAILRYPDMKETLPDGSYQETYINFTSKDYDAFSNYLQEKAFVAGDYYVNSNGELIIPLENSGTSFEFIYDQIGKRGRTVYPPESQIEPEFALSQIATATPAPTPEPTPRPTLSPNQIQFEHSEDYCYKIAMEYFKNLRWKNPDSVTVYGYTVSETNTGYIFLIDYSAQNSFGGNIRETYAITVNSKSGKVTMAFSY